MKKAISPHTPLPQPGRYWGGMEGVRTDSRARQNIKGKPRRTHRRASREPSPDSHVSIIGRGCFATPRITLKPVHRATRTRYRNAVPREKCTQLQRNTPGK